MNRSAPKKKEKRRLDYLRWGTYLLFFLFSALLHVQFFWLPAHYLFPAVKPSQKKRTLRVQSLRTSQKARRLRRQQYKKKLARQKKQARKRPRPRPKKKPPERRVKGQVVDVAPTPDSRRPEKSRFLSNYNTRVKKETVSRHRRLRYRTAMPRPTRRKPIRHRRRPRLASKHLSVRSRQKKGKSRTKKKKKSAPRFSLPRLRRRTRLALRLDPKLGVLQNRAQRDAVAGKGRTLRLGLGKSLTLKNERSQESKKKKGSSSSVPNVVNLRPNLGTLSRIQGAPAPDHVKNVEEGQSTFLNTKQWKHAPFFNRVKQGVAQHWNPVSVYRRRDPSGNVYGFRDRVTVLKVVLGRDGSLKAATVKNSSGLLFLDKEAIRAFRAAQPFPNPPRGLLDSDGKIRFSFGFLLELSSRPRFRLFRR
jgi:TonB family protein